jgi:pimeloyl-ACP methyl ester carboxylesterase
LPYVNNNGVNVFYEIEGKGTPLLLHHGLADTPKSWRTAGYTEPLAKQNQVILHHARGHGKSDKPHAPEKYSMEHMVSDVTAVLDDLRIDKAHFYGYSMGGRVGLAIGRYAPERFSSLIIGGNGLSEKDSEPEIEELQGLIRLMEQGVDSLMAFIEKERGGELEEWERDWWLKADLDAWIAYCSYYENIGMAEYLPTLTIPCLLYAGKEDTYPHSRAKACAEIMQNARFLSLPGLNHETAFHRSDMVLPHVIKFLNKQT